MRVGLTQLQSNRCQLLRAAAMSFDFAQDEVRCRSIIDVSVDSSPHPERSRRIGANLHPLRRLRAYRWRSPQVADRRHGLDRLQRLEEGGGLGGGEGLRRAVLELRPKLGAAERQVEMAAGV